MLLSAAGAAAMQGTSVGGAIAAPGDLCLRRRLVALCKSVEDVAESGREGQRLTYTGATAVRLAW